MPRALKGLETAPILAWRATGQGPGKTTGPELCMPKAWQTASEKLLLSE